MRQNLVRHSPGARLQVFHGIHSRVVRGLAGAADGILDHAAEIVALVAVAAGLVHADVRQSSDQNLRDTVGNGEAHDFSSGDAKATRAKGQCSLTQVRQATANAGTMSSVAAPVRIQCTAKASLSQVGSG